MPAFSLTPVNAFPQTDGTEFPQPLRFSQDDVLFVGPITQVNFVGGTVTEDGNGQLDVTLGGGGGTTNPGTPVNSFQWNSAGSFGGTVGMSWSPELLDEAVIAFTNLLVSDYNANWRPSGLVSVNSAPEATRSFAYIGAKGASIITETPPFSLPRACVWIGGPNDAEVASYDAWLISDGLVFQDRSANYIWFQPTVRAGAVVPVPAENFDDGFQVVINGTSYWVPLIAV
jgi:hypothetical protein